MSDLRDLASSFLNRALSLLGTDHPVRVGIGMILGCFFLGPVSVICETQGIQMSIYLVIASLAFGPLITMTPLLVRKHNTAREKIKQSVDAAELMFERGKLNDWDRREFYSSALDLMRDEIVDASKGKIKDVPIHEKVQELGEDTVRSIEHKEGGG